MVIIQMELVKKIDMKSILSILFIMMVCNATLFAQMSSPVRVKAGEDLYEKLAKEIYLYPAFNKGIISFKDGKMSQANFNYNMLNGEMQFIDAKGDTLSLANEFTIKYVTIAEDSFFYGDGYLRLIAENESAKIAKKQVIKVIDKQKIGAYDQPSSAGAVTSYSSISNELRNYKLNTRQDVLLAKQTSFYIGDKYNNFFKATKKNVLKNFPKKQQELNEHFKNNNVNFDKEEDLTKLIAVLKN
jgi:hypothetical protein